MAARAFEVHVRGELSARDLEELEYLTARVVPAQTLLTGVVPDQAALLGLLARLQSLGLEVVEVRRVPATSGDPGHPGDPGDSGDSGDPGDPGVP